MKVSELVAELTGHQPDGHVMIQEIDGMSNDLFVVESVLKEDGKLPLLMARRIPTSMGPPTARFPEIVVQEAFAAHMRGERLQHSYKVTIVKSDLDGRYRVNIDGKMVLADFGTESEARAFLRGYMMGGALEGTAK
jgi:hypothetical protein